MSENITNINALYAEYTQALGASASAGPSQDQLNHIYAIWAILNDMSLSGETPPTPKDKAQMVQLATVLNNLYNYDTANPPTTPVDQAIFAALKNIEPLCQNIVKNGDADQTDIETLISQYNGGAFQPLGAIRAYLTEPSVAGSQYYWDQPYSYSWNGSQEDETTLEAYFSDWEKSAYDEYNGMYSETDPAIQKLDAQILAKRIVDIEGILQKYASGSPYNGFADAFNSILSSNLTVGGETVNVSTLIQKIASGTFTDADLKTFQTIMETTDSSNGSQNGLFSIIDSMISTLKSNMFENQSHS